MVVVYVYTKLMYPLHTHPPITCTCTHIHTHVHTRMHARTRAYTHTYTHSLALSYTRAHTHMHVRRESERRGGGGGGGGGEECRSAAFFFHTSAAGVKSVFYKVYLINQRIALTLERYSWRPCTYVFVTPRTRALPWRSNTPHAVAVLRPGLIAEGDRTRLPSTSTPVFLKTACFIKNGIILGCFLYRLMKFEHNPTISCMN